MRIASYNIRKAVGLDWRRDAGRILDVLAEIDADVVVLQEADRRLGNRAGVLPVEQIERQLGLTLADLAVRRDSHGWHGNAILHKPRFSVAASARIDIPALEPRGAVSITLRAPCIEIVGTHLGLTAGTRRRQMQHLADHISGAPHPVVVAGDFNARRLAPDAFGDQASVVAPGHSFHAARPTAALDRFVLAGAVEQRSSHVHISALAKRASDHLPVVLEVAVPGQE